MDRSPLIALCTAPDPDVAGRIAASLVEERLAACVNALPQVVSTYRWQGKVERAEEVLLLIKTTADRYPELEMRVRQLHPYSVPEVIALPIATGHTDYLEWLAENTRR